MSANRYLFTCLLTTFIIRNTHCFFTNSINHKRVPHVLCYAVPPVMASGNDDEEEDCIVRKIRNVFLISDSTGSTGKSVLERALVQFSSCDDRFFTTFDETAESCSIQVKTFAHLRDWEDDIKPIIESAENNEAMVMFTLSDRELREKTAQKCKQAGLRFVDLLGPLLDRMSEFLQREPMGTPLEDSPRKIVFTEEYYRRVEAVEFTLQADDGAAPWLLSDADVVLVGVSRTGKTPLSVVLSQTQGLKVANVPLVLECPPPPELFELDPRRVFCLKINPNELKTIRKRRLELRGVKAVENKMLVDTMSKSNYADRNYLLKDLKNARALAESYGWSEIDVTGRAVEDSASAISSKLIRRFPGMF